MRLEITFKNKGYEIHIGDSARSKSAYWFGFSVIYYENNEVDFVAYYPFFIRSKYKHLKL